MHAEELIAELKGPTRYLRSLIPNTWQGFSELHQQALMDGALSTKTKELMALAIAVTGGCEGCIAYHARGAALSGATELEAAEAIGVALLMGGGPSSVYGPMALDAFKEFAEMVPAAVG